MPRKEDGHSKKDLGTHAQHIIDRNSAIIARHEQRKKDILATLLERLANDSSADYMGQLLASQDDRWVSVRRIISKRIAEKKATYGRESYQIFAQNSPNRVRTAISVTDKGGRNRAERDLELGLGAIVTIQRSDIGYSFPRLDRATLTCPLEGRGKNRVVLSPDEVAANFTSAFETAVVAALNFASNTAYGGNTLEYLEELGENWGTRRLQSTHPAIITHQIKQFLYQ